jgi:signal transduction histidine kinase
MQGWLRSPRSLRWSLATALILPVWGKSGDEAALEQEPAALHGLPFTRSYPLEEIGNVPRGATLSFDRFGRLTVVQDGFYSVLNETTWLDMADRGKGSESMPYIVQGNDNRAYYGSFGSWGIVEHTANGNPRPHPLRPPDPPKWVQTTGFSDIAVTAQGVFFGGWSGVVYWDFASQRNQFFEIFGFSKIFSIGDKVYVSSFGRPLQSFDVAGHTLQPVAGTNLGEDAIAQATSLDGSRALVSTRKGSIMLFDGSQLAPWPGQLRNNLTGRVTCLQHLLEGGVAVAIAGKGLYLVSQDGEMISALTSSEFHRITQLATREPGVLWAAGEDALQKVLYGRALTVFGQRLGLNPSWPIVVRWNGKIVVASGGLLFEAIPAPKGSASRFEQMKSQPAAGAWTVASSGTQLLVGNDKGAFLEEPDGSFTPVVPSMDVARLAMVGTDLCFAIGRVEIAAIRWANGRWSECAPRIPSAGFPSVVHSAKKSAWIELGNNRVSRLSLEGGEMRSQLFDNFPWKEGRWINVGIVDDMVVLSGPPGGRIFYDENTEAICAAPGLESLLDQSPHWIVRVQKDDSGTLWATHDEGVVTFVPRNGGYKMDASTFDLNNEHFPAVQLLPGNDVWLSTGQSLYHVDERRAFGTGGTGRQTKRVPPMLVSVTDGRTNTELLADAVSSTVPLRLPYSSNNLSFRFFSGGYGSRRTPVYEFRLSGGQTEWTSLGTGSLLSFPELHEGSYDLAVRIADAQGPTNPAVSLRFEILPPWHRTWPAYTLYTLAGALAVFGLTRWSVRRAHDRNVALEGIVRESTDQLKATMQKLNDETRNAATLAERGRLAGEIHDSVQQGLSGLMLQLDATLKLPAIASDVRSRLNVARNMISFTRDEVQHAVWDMESPLLEDTELDEALRKIATLTGSGAARIEISVSGTAFPIPSSAQHHLLRIAQEAITNAVRHAGPTPITVRLEYREGAVFLRVTDHGAGFAPNDVLENSVGHFGLRGLRGRAAKIGGELRIESSPGRGTTIEVVVPLVDQLKATADAATNAA